VVPANALPAGTYAARVTDSTGFAQTLTNALTVVQGGIGVLQTHVTLPDSIGNHGSATLYVQYGNVGDAPMPAPLLTLSAVRPSQDGTTLVQGAFLTLDPNARALGSWTSATPDGYGPTVQFLTSGSVPGVLQPGESVTVRVYYAGWVNSQWGTNPLTFTVSPLTDDNAQPIDWTSLQASLKPATISQAAWDAMYPNLVA
jgi:hypothetical protein